MVDTPSKKHIALCKRVDRIIRDWHPYIPWFWEWAWNVDAAPPDEIASMSVAYATYTLDATFLVRASALDLDDRDLELTVLHELGHIYLHELRMIYANTRDDESANWTDIEERLCWRFAKMLYRSRRGV